MVDKKYCMSSYLAFRFIEKNGVDFFEGLRHKDTKPPQGDEFVYVYSADELDEKIKEKFAALEKSGQKLGIMLSGGMDSACLASYMRGCDAYTMRFLGGKWQQEELSRAEYYAKLYDLKLHYVDISWEDVEKYLPVVVQHKNEPVHSIEPQIYKACLQAKNDGVEKIIFGECADSNFGGLDKLLSRDWGYEEFIDWFMFLDPRKVLRDPADVRYVFEPFKRGDGIDYIGFMRKVYLAESAKSYENVSATIGVDFFYPYQGITTELDLRRIRSGDSKYLVRDLFRKKYPGYPVPEKNPMPRPVDQYFADWKGPERKEFLPDLDMGQFSGNQKWQMWCLEWFLNTYGTES